MHGPIFLAASRCPNCAAGREARGDFWSDDWGAHVAAALLPLLLVVIAIRKLAHFADIEDDQTS